MKLELLYFDGCPSWELAAERLEAVAARRGLARRSGRLTDERADRSSARCVIATVEEASR